MEACPTGRCSGQIQKMREELSHLVREHLGMPKEDLEVVINGALSYWNILVYVFYISDMMD